ncbi:Cochaperone protein [Microsporum canis]|uniref:Glucose insensitive transcription protein 7 n=1 Tax=Arthroderma otae (strain ATCC MYA-4605 / CBS 113480) TaxID=554155 RepID=C5FHV9_ARTOC|nr:glucose insensitive transcription protein 7 [Microsporum canis CBS 113480]EEQ28939.1 glucose insensitive transcription protein 7 [Microsporum canis CBS 113480]
MDYAQKGAKALGSSDFAAAIKCYTKALAVNPYAADYYVKRSTAYSRVIPADGGPKLREALHDAEMAVALGIQRARREQILAGQMRRAIVLYQSERYGDAQYIFQVVRSKVGEEDPENRKDALDAAIASRGYAPTSQDTKTRQQLQIWEIKIKPQLAKLDPTDERAKVTVKETPDIVVPTQDELREIHCAQIQDGVVTSSAKSNEQPSSTTQANEDLATEAKPAQMSKTPPAAPLPSNTPSRTRHEWYQSNDSVVITIYAKGIPKDKADVDIQETSFSITFPLPSGSEFSFVLDPLFAPVDPSSSKFNIMSTKVEVTLRKQSAGRKWATLEGNASQDEKISPSETTALQDTSNLQNRPITTEKAPVYPTSSKSGPKDWDKVVSNIQKKEKKAKKKKGDGDSNGNEEDEGDSDLSDYGSGDTVDSFFKKLYANSDPDTRRAMTKSFYESNGTALNTNWSEVGKGKVKEHPPSDD